MNKAKKRINSQIITNEDDDQSSLPKKIKKINNNYNNTNKTLFKDNSVYKNIDVFKNIKNICKGFINKGKISYLFLGNYCYMNSVLQILIHYPDFANSFIRNTSSKKEKIIVILVDLLKQYINEDNICIDPTFLYEEFISTQKFFKNNKQDDCNLFFNKFVNTLEEIIGDKILSNINKFITTTEFKCKNCNYKSLNNDNQINENCEIILSLNKASTDINELLIIDYFYEMIFKTCEKCNKNTLHELSR